ncbi:MAG TPA: hypothetical protein VF411_10455 [Bacteroidia bacterium]
MAAAKKTSTTATTRTTSTSDTGHAKNVANFQTLIIDCQGFGTSYNPSNPNIAIPQLQNDYTNADTSITDVTTKHNDLNHTINTREVLFITLKPLATQIMAALKASGANAQTIKNAQTINHKIQGQKATKKIVVPPTPTPIPPNPTPNPGKAAAPVNISVSQQSFDNLVTHFSELVNYVALYPAYNPNERALKIVSLNTAATNFTTANNNVKTAHTAYTTAVATRTKTLYNPITGLVQIAKEVTAYVKSAFGASSAQFKEVQGVHFRTLVAGKPRKHHKKK